MTDWEVFQRDVLDLLKQYKGYFDLFERVGSLSDDSRPDCFARISRENKKEVWVIDAKNKPEIGEEDRQRMKKYLEMLKANPIDTGLEISELSGYSFRGIFVTSSRAKSERFESVAFKSLHQFLQKELVYTDTDRVVRDVSKMMERQELSQSQARLLFRSLKPYEDRYEEGLESLREIESKYTGLEVKEPPLEQFDHRTPVDAVMTHEERDIIFLFDIPYSREAVEKIDQKAQEVKNVLEGKEKEIYYAAINTFQGEESEYLASPENIEDEIRSKAGILSAMDLLELFKPKIDVEKEYFDGEVRLRSDGAGFRMAIKSEKDTRHRIEASLPDAAAKDLKNSFINSQRNLGRVSGNRYSLELEVTRDFRIKIGDGEKIEYSNFRDAVKSLYSFSVNPVLSRKISRKHTA